MLTNKKILISKYLSGNANAKEEKELMDWIKTDPANQTEFNQSEKLWKLSLNLKVDKDADVEGAWNEFKALTEVQSDIRMRKINFTWLKVAAAAALFIVTSVVIKLFFTEPTQPAPSVVSVMVEPVSTEPEIDILSDSDFVDIDTFEVDAPVKTKVKRRNKVKAPVNKDLAMITVTAGDSMEIFQLPDNSIVYLNANSTLEYPENFNKTNRRVSLNGEAYFDVKRDSGQFVVACENTIIRGKGSLFNIKSSSSDKEVEVIVASGMVEFSGIGYKDFKKLTLTSGESGYYDKAKSDIVKAKHIRKNYKWWQKKNLRARIKNFFDRLFGRNQ
ncbi:FecR family protein [Aurantibacillus circumpalustris]|uniref:FecR family protein n=1 Tax=Aurantibacillus circumpalustris TaxID=3036359 RepID=UPI00295AD1B0|nr:FecR family protein [Aurantibacillus circumpalustris]